LHLFFLGWPIADHPFDLGSIIQYVGKPPPRAQAQMLSLASLGKQVQEYVPEDANGEWRWLALLHIQLHTVQMDCAICEARINVLQSQIT
jgi:hypothetical protein